MSTGGSLILGKDNEADHVTYVALIGGKIPEKVYTFRAQAGNPNSHGVRGDGSGTGFGVDGVSTQTGTGVRGKSTFGVGVLGQTAGKVGADSTGVFGEASEDGGTALRGKAKSGTALYATSEAWGYFRPKSLYPGRLVIKWQERNVRWRGGLTRHESTQFAPIGFDSLVPVGGEL